MTMDMAKFNRKTKTLTPTIFVAKGSSDSNMTRVAGRLAGFVHAWESLQAPVPLLNIVKGYKIPFGKKPPLYLPKNIKRSWRTPVSPQMNQAIKEMMESGVLESAQLSPSFISPMFLTPKSDGTMRPIFNLKNLNNYVQISKFRLINIQKIPDFLQPRDWLAKIDISSAYFHVPISPSHRRFLRLIYDNNLLEMTCLPFGLATAPKVFSMLTNWIAQVLRDNGVRIVTYLDDYLLVNQDQSTLSRHIQDTVDLLHQLGWQINLKKSTVTPQKCLEFLGICWDPWQGLKWLPPKKCLTLQAKIDLLLERKTANLKEIQSLVGLINFASFPVPRGRLNHRSLLQFQNYLLKLDSCHRVALPEPALAELKWWAKNHSNQSRLHAPPVHHFLTTDASDLAWGARLDDVEMSGTWQTHEANLHSNVKEMLAVYYALKEQSHYLLMKSVMLQSDNRTVVSYIKKEGGSRSMNLMHVSKMIFALLDKFQIHLVAHHLPGKLNSEADHLSRFQKAPEWHLLQEITSIIFKKWGTPCIDLMASNSAHVVPRYVSLDRMDRNAHHHDAFSREWHYSLAWIFPPPFLIPKVLTHLNTATGVYLIVAPVWEKVFWRPDIKNRALSPPFTIRRLHRVLVDTSTGLPPPQVREMTLEVWRCGGGPTV
ncbi:hypothetical protein JYU34_010004 [Plutella xylostella]|uniref:Reverse transcriptase domain-containing protein n=1 Tax=Plutella xylostella TaxID=51655 RepID=A0ABQ7QHI4_PLUXY|nr:hypothetical protein JYU34_010004 [Plutella xylostella]